MEGMNSTVLAIPDGEVCCTGQLNFSKVPSTEHMSIFLCKAIENIWPTGLCDWQNFQMFHFGKEMSLHGMELPAGYSTATAEGERFSNFSFI